MSYPVTDRNGHKYHSENELKNAIEFLEGDSKYLAGAVDDYRDPAVKERVARNAKNSENYANELKSMLKVVAKE